MKNSSLPLIVHVVYRFALGGMEHGLATLITRTADRYRHAVVSLTDYTDFAERVTSKNVRVIPLHKPPGRGVKHLERAWRTFRDLRPDIVHTRNLGAMECAAVAAIAGVPRRVHGEHGRDVYDIDGKNRRYNLLRRGLRPFIHHYTAVSRDLADWLVAAVRVRKTKVTQIYNGVDASRFSPQLGDRKALPQGFAPDDAFVIGSVGRMEAVKSYDTLIRAFLRLVERCGMARNRLRLVIVGNGSERNACAELVRAAGADDLVWLPGQREDVPFLMRAFDVFVLPSRGEGISNTILEAMATGLPIVATRVGGNVELVDEGTTGTLVRPSDPQAMGDALESYFVDPALRRLMGHNGRMAAEQRFSIDAMVHGYSAVYESLLRS
jgi:sugar transferase (PEP-CTERM/EpsH1 system associated)